MNLARRGFLGLVLGLPMALKGLQADLSPRAWTPDGGQAGEMRLEDFADFLTSAGPAYLASPHAILDDAVSSTYALTKIVSR